MKKVDFLSKMLMIKMSTSTMEKNMYNQDMSKAPTGWHKFFLVRPLGIHPGSGEKYLPTVVQYVDGEFYGPMDELTPIYFGQNEPIDSEFRCKGFEWCHLPD